MKDNVKQRKTVRYTVTWQALMGFLEHSAVEPDFRTEPCRFVLYDGSSSRLSPRSPVYFDFESSDEPVPEAK